MHPGDEVIVLDPCYDSYLPNIALAGGVAVRVPLKPRTFRPDFAKIAAAITPRTRLLIINTPHNPSATVWTAEEMRTLEELLAPTDVLLISAEVYKLMGFWRDKGVGGFRLDVINLISKPAHFPEDNTDGRRFYTDGPNVHEYLQEMHREVFAGHEDRKSVV